MSTEALNQIAKSLTNLDDRLSRISDRLDDMDSQLTTIQATIDAATIKPAKVRRVA